MGGGVGADIPASSGMNQGGLYKGCGIGIGDMKTYTPLIYILSVFVVYAFVWYSSSDDRVTNMIWLTPPMLIANFSVLWGRIHELERELRNIKKVVTMSADSKLLELVSNYERERKK
ncbi:MAG: hypothetical protein ACK4KV_15405 [Rhodocyclaceae bacterium]